MPGQPMPKETLIYDALTMGSGHSATSAMFVCLLLAIGFTALTWTLHTARKKGQPLTSSRRATTLLWGAMADHPWLAIAAIWMLCSAASAAPAILYWQEREILAEGKFAVHSGVVTSYVTAEVNERSGRLFNSNRVAGLRGTLREIDRLVVDGWTFQILCDRSPDEVPGVVGKAGACLKLQPGRIVRVQYVLLSATRYRAEPLRVWEPDQ
jgi:hypothetical protein